MYRYDQVCRLLNNATWSCLVELRHPVGKPIDPLLGLGPTCEVLESNNLSKSNHAVDKPHRVAIYLEDGVSTNYSVVSRPMLVPSIKPDPQKPNPKVGRSS